MTASSNTSLSVVPWINSYTWELFQSTEQLFNKKLVTNFIVSRILYTFITACYSFRRKMAEGKRSYDHFSRVLLTHRIVLVAHIRLSWRWNNKIFDVFFGSGGRALLVQYLKYLPFQYRRKLLMQPLNTNEKSALMFTSFMWQCLLTNCRDIHSGSSHLSWQIAEEVCRAILFHRTRRKRRPLRFGWRVL